MRYLVLLDVSMVDIVEAEDNAEAIRLAGISGNLAWAIREDLAMEYGLFDAARRVKL